MTPTPASVHSALRLAKGLTTASIKASMDSRKDSEKFDIQEERLENTPFSRNEALHDTPAAHHDGRIAQEKAADRKTGLTGTFQKLGNLPEWKVPGCGQLRGKALNDGIAWTSCLAFLMFGMSSNQIVPGTN